MTKQLTDKIIMIRPKSFGFNQETAANNKFQNRMENIDQKNIQSAAIKEFDQMVTTLREHKIEVTVFDDFKNQNLPDSVFPNNWITTHEDGSIFTYPMFAPIRRMERREDVIEYLEKNYQITKRYSLELFEIQNQFLEGTGSMIFDRIDKIAYACISPRTDARVLHKFSLLSGFKIVLFRAADQNGFEIYHTNVLMSIGEDFVICCMNAIEEQSKDELKNSFEKTGKLLINLSFEQMTNFAGNMLELANNEGQRYLVLSKSAHNSLKPSQLSILQNRTKLLVVDIPTIEKIGGGSARCMIAENFLVLKNRK